MFEGFCSVEVFPSPKFQLHELAPPVDKSVNWVGFVMQTDVAEKFAAGCGYTVTIWEMVEVHPPGFAEIFSAAVYVPEAV